MNQIHIEGETQQRLIISFIKVHGFPDSTSHAGGYDVNGEVEIQSGNYFVKGSIWITTGEIFSFYEALKKVYRNCDGKAEIQNFEKNFQLSIEIDKRGRATIQGKYNEHHHVGNELIFSFESDQSYLVKTIEELKDIHLSYGGMMGIKDL
jgi:hypothetical protein